MQGVGSPPAPGSAPVPPSSAAAPRAQPPRLRHSFWWYIKWTFHMLSLVIFCLIVVTVCIGKGMYDELSSIVVDARHVTSQTKVEATRVYAADGSLLAEFKGDEREWVSFDKLLVLRKRGKVVKKEPCRLIDATLAVEDVRFYSHPGMDPKRILGAALANYKSGNTAQGGSTITEQLAVNLFLKRTKKLSRRLQTAMLALQLERRFSKDEILELYLNEIFYGNRATGCEAAAHLYFNKPARDLSIAQAAFLAGLPQQPSRLDPFVHFPNAIKRQHIVLHEMWENKKINWGQYQDALRDTSIETSIARAHRRYTAQRRAKPEWKHPYFVSYVRQYLQHTYDWSSDYIDNSGLKIYTTLDPDMQSYAETLMQKRLAELSYRKGMLEGALVCIDPWTGHVLTVVGGRDYYDMKHSGLFNRATQAKRQVGSSFKPYVYATALEMGYGPGSRVVDSPMRVLGTREVSHGGHEIKNYDFIHRGNISFREALGLSDNVAATRVLLKVGIPNVIQKAHLMGIQSSLVPYPSLALGASVLTPLEHTSAFGVFATRGLRAEATPVERVENAIGEVIMEHTHPVHGARVLSPEAAGGMWEMLRYVVTSGTGKPAYIDGVDMGGKTGTTSDNKDIWFMGATKDLVCGVWMGYDRPQDLGYGSAGGKWCGPVWRNFMVHALDVWRDRHPVQKMVEDARATQLRKMQSEQFKKYVRVKICNESGMLATAACPNTHWEEFSSAGGATGGAPSQYCTIHTTPASGQRPLSEGGGTSQAQPGDLGYDPSKDHTPGLGAPSTGTGGTDTSEDAGQADASATANGGATATSGATANGGGGTPDTGPSDPNLARHSNIAYHPHQDAPAAEVQQDTATGAGNNEVLVTVCADSGELATSHCPVTVQRFFTAADAPHRYCTLHRRSR